MLNDSLLESYSDSIVIPTRHPSVEDAPAEFSTPNIDEEAHDGLHPPNTPKSSWDTGVVWRRWFDAMTNDGDENEANDDPGSDGEWSSSAHSSTTEEYHDGYDDCAGLVDENEVDASGPVNVDVNQTVDSLSTLCKCPVTILDGFSTFEAIILSQWDDVVGPCNKHVWTRGLSAQSTFCSKLLPFHPVCTLNGEISRENVGLETAEYKFYLLSEIGYAMGSFIFTTPSSGSLYAISLVLPATQLESYLAIQRLCINRMRHLIKKLQIILKTDVLESNTIDEFTELLQSFLIGISRIGIHSFPSDSYQLEKTAFGKANKHTIDQDFLAAAITVHLESGGVSIILGEDIKQINVMIDTLSLFLHEDECKRSRYAYDVEFQYAPDLVLQGIITDGKKATFDSSILSKSTSPSTIIDVTRKTARHARSPDEHQILHEEADKIELRQLKELTLSANKSDGRPANKVEAKSRRRKVSLVNSTVASAMVEDLLGELNEGTYSPEVRLAMIRHFCLRIARKANIIIQFVTECGADPIHPVPFEQLRFLRKHLALPTEPDFRIVLAEAERLQPGTYPSIYGDPVIREENIVHVFSDLWTA
eukprot:m.69609 g.69609  ORF g.69609 m.69609 type:complete len:591 (-) comp24114_c0_seq1:156-1928(-)